MKLSRKKILIGIAIAFVLSIAIYITYFMSTTMSFDQAEKYCRENSRRGAQEFYLEDWLGSRTYRHNYFYMIATDGDENKPQEAFVFRTFPMFGLIDNWMRYKPYAQSVHDDSANDNTKIGVLQFTVRNDKGKKEPGDHLLFFSNNRNLVKKITFDFSFDGKTTYHEERAVNMGNQAFALTLDWQGITDLHGYQGENDGVFRKISNVKLYGADGQVVYEY
ncbi:MAG: hypothetical protein LBJ12_08935 [Oscillospiraceae bacterium]|jgi:hypothetical protein|nr:hypothetical protein [Oscillospiraceae bacterium]